MPTNAGAGPYSSPSGSPQPWGSPASTVPSSPYGTAPSPYGTSPYGTAPSPYGTTPYGTTPGPTQGESLFPNGIFPQNPNGSTPPQRLFDNLRLRETWIYGDGNQQLGINDIETAVTMMLPHFLGTQTPLMLSPNFALHLWDGPAPPSHTQFMPGNAYSAYLEAAYNTDHAKPLGVDLAASIGVFTDFETMTTDSVRIQTLSYFWARLTPTMMLKLGVDYLDRVDVKILPAVGILYEPNPQTRLDIFFPRPKLAHLFNTVGTTDIWWYLAGEYGGGSWTIHNDLTGFVDQVDINDIRIMLGFDWSNQSGVRGMIEVGWVMQRELVYRNTPSENTGLSDSFMLRGGVAF